MNSELTKQALAIVGSPNVLINVVSRRVRQLTSAGAPSRPLIVETAGMGAADIALTEIIEGKMAWELVFPDEEPSDDVQALKKRAKH